jgi:hypothetical protein
MYGSDFGVTMGAMRLVRALCCVAILSAASEAEEINVNEYEGMSYVRTYVNGSYYLECKASCDDKHRKLTGGGFSFPAVTPQDVLVVASHPFVTRDHTSGWRVVAKRSTENENINFAIECFAVCAPN